MYNLIMMTWPTFIKLSLCHIVFQYMLAGKILGDFLKIKSDSTVVLDDKFMVTIEVAVADPSGPLLVWFYLQSSIGPDTLLATRYYELISLTKDNSTVVTNITISKRWTSFDSRHLDDPTDYFAKNFKAKACMFYTMTASCSEELSDEVIVPLSPPWRRKEIKTYCPAWSLHVKMASQMRSTPQCAHSIGDTVLLASSPLAIAGVKDQGFVKKLQAIKWPKHVPERVKKSLLSHPRFTLEFKIFMLEKCKNDFCEVLAHRLSLKFLTPMILLNRKGLLHFQFHDINEAGEAFVTSTPLPIRRWLHVVITVDGNQTQVVISNVYGASVYHNYVYRFKSIEFKSESGIWSIGGSYGSHGLRGIVCCARLHRRKSLDFKELQDDTSDLRILQHLRVSRTVKKCSVIQSMYYSMLKKHSVHMAACKSESFERQFSNRRQCDRKFEQEVPKSMKETVKVLVNFMKNSDPEKLHKKDVLAKELNVLGFGKITNNTNNANDAMRFFELSCCLGYYESSLATSLIQYLDANASHTSAFITSWEIFAASHNNELAQLALSYKHQLGCGGVRQDMSIAAGYAKAAALSIKRVLENEEQLIHTSTEKIRLDEAHLFAGKRGMSSDVMKWLRHQAEWGSMSAQNQMAEILFHGQHGVNAQRNEAVNLYRAGAVQGDANAMYNLGVLYLRGIEVEKNETLAMDLLKKAAKKNLSIAINSLGYHELVNKQNMSGALHYWNEAAALDDKDAMTNLGIQYENGVAGILEADKQKAFGYFKKSAEKGQRDACIKYADYLVIGEVALKDEFAAISYYRYVAEQSPTLGLYLRNAFDSYGEGNWNTSLVMYMLVSETGLALGSFNAALLCDEMLENRMSVGSLGTNCSLHFHNLSSVLGWPLSIIRMGDEYWYGRRLAINRTKAAINYARLARSQDSPQALFNLGFMIENDYPLDGIKFDNPSTEKRGNLTLAKIFYERCQRSTLDYGDGYYPCSIALLNLKFKSFMREQKVTVVLCSLVALIFAATALLSSDEIN